MACIKQRVFTDIFMVYYLYHKMGNFRSKQDLTIKEFEKFLGNEDFREKTKMEIILDYEDSRKYIQVFISYDSDNLNEELKVHMFTNKAFGEFVQQIRHLYHLLTIKYHYQQIQALPTFSLQSYTQDQSVSILEEGAPQPFEEISISREIPHTSEEYTRIENLIEETQCKISEILDNSHIVM